MIDERWRTRLAWAGAALADFIYPPSDRCAVCDRKGADSAGSVPGLCAGCRRLLQCRPDVCPVCGGAVPQPVGRRPLEHDCPGAPPGGYLHYLGEDRGVLRRAVRRHRGGADGMTGLLGSLLAESLARSPHPLRATTILPAPDFSGGSGRNEVLAAAVAGELDRPLRRTLPGEETSPSFLAGMVARGREQPLPHGVKRLLLVDDIYVRGGDAARAARRLRERTGLPVSVAAPAARGRSGRRPGGLPLGTKHNRFNFRLYRR